MPLTSSALLGLQKAMHYWLWIVLLQQFPEGTGGHNSEVSGELTLGGVTFEER